MSAAPADPSDHLVIVVRRHWVSFGLWWRGGLVVLLSGAVAWLLANEVPARYLYLPILTLLMSISIALFVVPLLDWLSTRARLSARQLTITSGLIRPRSRSIPLSEVRDAIVSVDRLGGLLGYGSVRLVYEGEPWEQILLPDIAEPEVFRGLLMEYARRAGSQVPPPAE